MVETTNPGKGDDLGALRELHLGVPWNRRVLVEPEMCSVVSMIGRVLHHESVQVALTEDDDSIEDLASTGANPPFGDSVLPGTPVGRPDGVDAHPLERAVDIGAELGVPVEDESLIFLCPVRRSVVAVVESIHPGTTSAPHVNEFSAALCADGRRLQCRHRYRTTA
jgi:hypothetical protein